MNKKNIILTGSEGNLGILIQKELKDLNYNLIKIDNKKVHEKCARYIH